MSPTHDYDLVKETDDLLRESDEVRDEPRRPAKSAIPAWWKILLFIALAFSAGLGAAVGVVLASSLFKTGDNASTTTSVAVSGAASANAALLTASSTASADVAVSTSVDHLTNVDNDPPELIGKVLDCGWSIEEAKAKGCVYDVMMQDWVPEPCYDSLLTEKYLAKGNYTWYSDMEGHTMTDEEMRKGEHGRAWMSANYHKDHCIFSWEKLVRALRNNRPISQELVSYDHVLHCHHQGVGDSGMMKRDSGSIGVAAPTNYAKCALYGTWKLDFLPDKHSSADK
ncbi:hypothetical protein B0A52_02717 [Exophiala mesophila]|uniref:Uncharacterized protein n=1 Tax=Exophiala mesophila TaxID=212818 RepID=A0A438NDG7_EXOME|nr:hypothetical protein B0A52_02717 [Exophiala mesophila]